MVIARVVVLVISASFSFLAVAGEDFLQSLTEQKVTLAAAISEAGTGVIYSETIREHEYSYIERNLTHRAEYEAQVALWTAAKEFIEYLESASEQYYDLPYSQWLLVSDTLLSIDSLLQNDIGWGNLIIKVCIYNKLYYWIFDYIDKTEDIDKNRLSELMAVLTRLRSHIPSREAMTYLALRYYGYDDYKKPSDFRLTIPVSEEADVLEKNVYAYFGSKDEAALAVSKIIGEESGKEVDGYVDLYKNPLPWFAAQGGSDYTEFFWALYMALLLMHDNDIAFGQSKSVTSEELSTLLEKVYNSENRFWMTRAAVDAAEKPEIYASRYLESVQRNRIINEIIRNYREHARAGKSVSSRRFSPAKFD